MSTSTSLDRRRQFLIEDGKDSGPALIISKKSIHFETGVVRATTCVIAFRDHGTQQSSNIVRFIYSVPSTISNNITKWIAIPHSI